MKFLYPNFLWALLFVAIPIIIHLFYFRRYKRVLFSNTKFLQEVKEEKATKNKLKHLLVLLSRILTIIFLVLAFAQPFLPKNKQSSLSEKLISVYLDNSFSMQAEGQGYLLFDEAKNLAKKIIDSYSENNKFQILTNDFEAKHQRIVSKAEALTLVDELIVGPAIQDKSRVKEKQDLSAKNFEGQVVLYQLSDFQLGNGLAEADSTNFLNLVRFEPSNLRNISIEELSMESPVQLLGQNNKLLVKLSNQSNEEQSGSFQMILNGVPKSLGNYTIPPKDFVIDTLSFTINQEGWNQGQITLNDYPLSFDDDYYFSFYVENQMEVYCIYEGNAEKYPKAVFAGNEQVNFKSSSSKAIDYNLIKDQHLLILSELNSISTGLSEAIKLFLEQGGQVYIIPSSEINLASYNQFLASLSFGTWSPKKNENKKLSQLNLEHELVQGIFEEAPSKLEMATINSIYPLSKSLQQINILSFADGASFVTAGNFGRGTVYLQNGSLNKADNNFAEQAIFAPLVFKMAILGLKNHYLSFWIDANTGILLKKSPKNSESLLSLRREAVEIIPQKSIYNGELMLNIPGNNLLSGHYTVENKEEAYLAKVSLNYKRSESQLAYYSKEEMEQYYLNTGVQILENNLAAINENIKDLEDGKSFWKLCLILALIFLAFEVILLRFIPN